MCGTCGGKRKRYQVTYPDGRQVIKGSAVAAQIAASKVEGATWVALDE